LKRFFVFSPSKYFKENQRNGVKTGVIFSFDFGLKEKEGGLGCKSYMRRIPELPWFYSKSFT